jgi:hypothetical protein
MPTIHPVDFGGQTFLSVLLLRNAQRENEEGELCVVAHGFFEHPPIAIEKKVTTGGRGKAQRAPVIRNAFALSLTILARIIRGTASLCPGHPVGVVWHEIPEDVTPH